MNDLCSAIYAHIIKRLKCTKLAIFRSAFLHKTPPLKTQTIFLQGFSIFFHEIFSIDVELNFALLKTIGFSKIFQKKCRPNSKRSPGKFRIWPSNFSEFFSKILFRQVNCEIKFLVDPENGGVSRKNANRDMANFWT